MDYDFSIQKEQLVDLTHSYSSETIYWPTEEGFVLDTKFEGTVDIIILQKNSQPLNMVEHTLMHPFIF
jgi:kynurenine formamidase